MDTTTPQRLSSNSSIQSSIPHFTPSANFLPALDGVSPVSAYSSATSNPFLDSPSPWKSRKQLSAWTKQSRQAICSRPVVRWTSTILVLALTLLLLRCLPSQVSSDELLEEWHNDVRIQEVLRPAVDLAQRRPREDPETWIRKQSALSDEESVRQPRPKAALISLVRNEELGGILQSMRQLEYHWNHKYNYPWIFFSEKPFSDEFKASALNPGPSSS
jgi:Glycolipid 2-alpha-mannosyltransferase